MGFDYERLAREWQHYVATTGKTSLPRGYISESGYKLKQQVSVARKNYKKGIISEENVNLLSSVGFVWEVGFDYERLAREWQHYVAITGNAAVPKVYVSESGYKLGQQVSHARQYYKKGKISEENIELLNSVGFVWKVGFNYEILACECQNYIATTGNAAVPRDYVSESGYKLGQQVSVARQNYRKGMISKENIELLNSVGFIWDASRKFDFEMLAKEWQLYVETTGKTSISEEYISESEYKLSQQVSHARQYYKKGMISEEDIALLNSVGFIWGARRKKGNNEDE